MAGIIERCDCGDWDDCPHPWIVHYRTDGQCRCLRYANYCSVCLVAGA